MSMPATMTRLVGTKAERRKGRGTGSPVSKFAQLTSAIKDAAGKESKRADAPGWMDESTTVRMADTGSQHSFAPPVKREVEHARCLAFHTPASSSCPQALRP